MDWTQVTLAIIIPLIVSVVAWTLTYILPYIIPRQFSDFILYFMKFQNPKDPNEIQIYINQYLEYVDWKMLTAKGMLDAIFEHKFEKFEIEEKEFWNELKNKIEIVPVKEGIRDIKNRLKELGQPKTINGELRYQGFEAVGLSRLLEFYQDVCRENEETNIWHFKELSKDELHRMLNIDVTPNIEQGQSPAVIFGNEMPYRKYTTREVAEIMAKKNMQLFEVNGKWTNESADKTEIASPESFLLETGLEKPVENTSNQKIKIFNKILLNLDLKEHDNIKGLSIALSDMEDSMAMFKTIIHDGSDITPLKTRFLNKLKNKTDLTKFETNEDTIKNG